MSMNKCIIFLTIVTTSCLAEFNLEDVEIPDFEDISLIKDRCDRLGGESAYWNLKKSKEALQLCTRGFIDFTVLRDEIEESKKTGSMDEVFGKYCEKRTTIEPCVRNFTDSLKFCLETEEKKALNVTLNILKQLGEFVCFKNGDRIAMFVAEGGIECIKSRFSGIKNCINATLKIAPTVSTTTFPNLLIDKKKCEELGELQTCVVEDLEKCRDSTPANVVDALFRFIKRSACLERKKRDVFESTELKLKLLQAIKPKCDENAPANSSYEVVVANVETTFECLNNKTARILTAPDGDRVESEFRTCLEELVGSVQECLPEEEKYIADFYLDMLVALSRFIHKNREKLTSRSLKMEVVDCFQNFRDEATRNRVIKCVEPSDDRNITKVAVCGRLETSKNCMSQELGKVCRRDVAISAIANEFFIALTSPCANTTINTN